MVRAAVERVAADANEIQGMRVKAGRVISAANRSRIQAVLDALGPLAGELRKLLEESEPAPKSADPDTIRGLMAQFELTRPSRLLGTARS
jgi:hypothetical protein